METGLDQAEFLERITPDSSFTLCLFVGKTTSEARPLSVFDLHRLRRNSDDDVVWFDITRDHRAGADHRVISDLRPGQHGRVIRNTHAVANPRWWCVDLVNVVNVVVVRVDVCVIRDRDVVANVDPTAIVEQYVTMDDDVVSE